MFLLIIYAFGAKLLPFLTQKKDKKNAVEGGSNPAEKAFGLYVEKIVDTNSLKISKRNPKNGLLRNFLILQGTKSWKISQFRAFHFISLKESMNYTIKILQWIMVLKKLGSHSYGWVSKIGFFCGCTSSYKQIWIFWGFLSNQLFMLNFGIPTFWFTSKVRTANIALLSKLACYI